MTARFIDNGGKRSLEILDSSAFVAFVASGRLRRRLQHSVRRHRHAQLEHLAHIGLVVQHHQVRVAALVQVALVADLQGVRRVVGDGPHRLGQRGARPAHQVAHARGQVRGGARQGVCALQAERRAAFLDPLAVPVVRAVGQPKQVHGVCH